MKYVKKYVIYSLVPMCLLGCATQGGSGDLPALTGEDLGELLPGRTATWQTGDRRFRGATTWYADGTQRLTSDIPDIETDTGTWTVRGEELCSSWTKVRNGTESCAPLLRRPDGSYQFNETVLRFDDA